MAALAVIGFFNIIGSYTCGALGGRFSKRLILAWIYAIRALAIGLFIALPLTVPGTYLFAAVLGLQSRRGTHFANFVRYVRTTATSQSTKRAARAD